jgi:hypothetical protein
MNILKMLKVCEEGLIEERDKLDTNQKLKDYRRKYEEGLELTEEDNLYVDDTTWRFEQRSNYYSRRAAQLFKENSKSE